MASPIVSHLVQYEVRVLAKGLATVFALEGLLPGVHTLVNGKF